MTGECVAHPQLDLRALGVPAEDEHAAPRGHSPERVPEAKFVEASSELCWPWGVDDAVGRDIAVFPVGDAEEEGGIKAVVVVGHDAAPEGRVEDAAAKDPAGGGTADDGCNVSASNDFEKDIHREGLPRRHSRCLAAPTFRHCGVVLPSSREVTGRAILCTVRRHVTLGLSHLVSCS